MPAYSVRKKSDVTIASKVSRTGAAAVAAGLLWAGPQALGVAVADSQEEASSASAGAPGSTSLPRGKTGMGGSSAGSSAGASSGTVRVPRASARVTGPSGRVAARSGDPESPEAVALAAPVSDGDGPVLKSGDATVASAPPGVASIPPLSGMPPSRAAPAVMSRGHQQAALVSAAAGGSTVVEAAAVSSPTITEPGSAEEPSTQAGVLLPAAAEGGSPTAAAAEGGSPTAAVLPTAEDPWAVRQRADPVKAYQENTAAIITAVTSNLELLIDGLPAGPVLHDALAGMLWTIRRSLFNLAPTMDQSYSVTAGLGTVTGKATATDPEGDRIQYMVVQGPAHGSLTLNVDGGYVYTPGAGFEGVDTFVIAANDLGWHINLLEPFGVAGASASMLVNQNAIDFSFDYNDPDGYFTDQARQALYKSAKRLSAYFLVDHPTVLTYKVNSVNTDDATLASAVSKLINKDDPGFWPTIVQEKLLTGVDANGAEADGDINWNWLGDGPQPNNWGFYPTVEYDQFDATATIMHELVHSFGWESVISVSPVPRCELACTTNRNWSLYDKFVTTFDGNSPIDADTYLWNSAYDPYLVGYGGGMFFTGANAMAAYAGRPVPLWTPNNWMQGSSIAHLDDGVFSGSNHAMMDAVATTISSSIGFGPGKIVLSPVELGVLMDLGYTVVPSPWFAYPP